MCGTFIFATNTIAVGVQIEILQNGAILFTVMFNKSLTLDIAEGCIPINISGYYDLYIYDVENDNTLSQLPAIIKNQVFVDEQTTTSTSTTTVSSISSTSTTSSSTPITMTMSPSSSSVSLISTTSTS